MGNKCSFYEGDLIVGYLSGGEAMKNLNLNIIIILYIEFWTHGCCVLRFLIRMHSMVLQRLIKNHFSRHSLNILLRGRRKRVAVQQFHHSNVDRSKCIEC